MKKIFLLVLLAGLIAASVRKSPDHDPPVIKSGRPNILFAIADDQSFPHASAYGSKTFLTPAFDNVAARGVLFNNAFVAAPQCSPSRAALLTGRNIWQLEEAGTHSSYFPKKFPVFTDALESSGYFIGYTGKPWGPGNFEGAGRSRNPVGPAFNRHEVTSRAAQGISRNDYASNFGEFLSQRQKGQPFFFWYGGMEPHRGYEEGSGAKAGLTITKSEIPGFLPDTDTVRSDLLDYALEIGWFDSHLGKMLAMLEDIGELENTIVVVTADNGMAFPYAKANLQEYGIHVPFAACGPGIAGAGRRVDDLVSLADLCPTFLEAAGLPVFEGVAARSLWPVLKSRKSGYVDQSRKYILAGRERHTHARPDNVGYPARAIRTKDYLYMVNFLPERWPLGDPPPRDHTGKAEGPDFKPITEGYEDIDSSPSKTFLTTHRAVYPDLFRMAFEKRGREELYDIRADPYCLYNLASSKATEKIRQELEKELMGRLTLQGDPRVTGGGEVFDSYPRFGPMRPFEGFKERGKYNPRFMPGKRPNIILILTDDLGWSSLSSAMDRHIAGAKSDYHETPAIDRMIREGMRFSRGYAPDPICTPSRRSIQFGQTSLHQGDEEFAGNYKNATARPRSIPETLKSIDPSYAAAHFGKWDLRADITPEHLGYDQSDGDTGNRDGDLSQERGEKWLKEYLHDNPKQIDSLTARAIRFMARQSGADKPFYLQVSHYATHVNFETKPQTHRKFADKKKGTMHDNTAWAGMIYDLDAGIGRLFEALDSLGLSENTYVFFMADNGGVEFVPPVSNRLDPPSAFSKPMRNAPLRGGKWTLYEGGIRVPFIVKGPGIKAGTQSDVPVAGWDLLPTFSELAGNSPLTDDRVDGGSFVSLLKNDGKGNVVRPSEDFYFHRFHNSYPHSAIISGSYKLIHFWKTGTTEFYDLAKDPGEIRNIRDKEKARAAMMEKRLFSYIRKTNPHLTFP